MWVAVFQGNLQFISLGGFLKMEVVGFFRAVSIPDYFVSVWKETNRPNAFWFQMKSRNGGGTVFVVK